MSLDRWVLGSGSFQIPRGPDGDGAWTARVLGTKGPVRWGCLGSVSGGRTSPSKCVDKLIKSTRAALDGLHMSKPSFLCRISNFIFTLFYYGGGAEDESLKALINGAMTTH